MTEKTQLVWLLLGKKAGDNAQLRALAGALTLPLEVVEKKMAYRSLELVLGRLFGESLFGIDSRRSDPIEAPWPDLVLSAGRRNEAVARHVRKRSGGRTRLVHLGRPWAHPDHFDLVIKTPQYDLPSSPRVIEVGLPLQAPLASEPADPRAEETRRILRALPAPRIAVLLGGNAGTFDLTGKRVARLIRELEALRVETGGSLVVVSSRRTPPSSLAALRQGLHEATLFATDLVQDAFNPYATILDEAERFVVTADSVSMTAEALARGRPLQVFDSRRGRSGDGPGPRDLRLGVLAQRLSGWCAPRRLHREIMAIHERLRSEGRTSFLGEEPSGEVQPYDFPGDLERAARAVEALLD